MDFDLEEKREYVFGLDNYGKFLEKFDFLDFLEAHTYLKLFYPI